MQHQHPHLSRFVRAQEDVFDTALTELRAGRKRSHWMWFVFPQLRGLGRSSTAQFYGIASLDEARAYLAHPLLGPRLRQATQATLPHAGRCAQDLFGSPDDLKFRSSMTLFSVAGGEPGSLFEQALQQFFDGKADEATLELLRAR